MKSKYTYSFFLFFLIRILISQENYEVKKAFYIDSTCVKNGLDIEHTIFSNNIPEINKECVWIKLEVKNNTKEDGICIASQIQQTGLVLYKTTKDVYDLSYDAPVNKRDFRFNVNFAYLPVKCNDTDVYYIKLPTNVTNVDFTFSSKSDVLNEIAIKEKVNLFFIGIFIVMFLYNLFIYFSVKEKSHLYYSISILLSLLLWINNAGFLSRFLYPDHNVSLDYKIGLIVSALYGTFFILFSQAFLKLKVVFPKWHLYLNILMILILSVPFIQVVFGIDPLLLNGPSFLSGMILFISSLILSIYGFFKKLKEIRFYLIGNLLFIMFTIYFFLAVFKVIPQNQFFVFSMEAGTVMQIIFFSFALADKINILKSENELANQRVIVQLQENDLIKSEINVRLEKEVKERTFEIEAQKNKIQEKNKEILDSISYAKRLQEAILPPIEFVNKYVSDNFILYKPKDIVAGDFYWAESINDLFFISAADSTGHGVPGAMVSVVCSNALNRSVKEFGFLDTGKILDKTRDLVIETFEKSASEVKDGMDISLLCIDLMHKKLFWSGANNPLWYISNSELKEIKADKQPIGKTEYVKKFTTHQIEYNVGDIFYLLTDGYPDQFGGPKGKKFKYKQLSELFVSMQKEPLYNQKEILTQVFDKWKLDLEQVDDVTIIGLKLS